MTVLLESFIGICHPSLKFKIRNWGFTYVGGIPILNVPSTHKVFVVHAGWKYGFNVEKQNICQEHDKWALHIGNYINFKELK